MARKPPPLSSFMPELLEVWKKAALQPVKLTLADRSAAIRLRYRLYSLRKSMEAANHELFSSAQHAVISIRETPGAHTWDLIVQPSDSDLQQAIRSAGIEVEEAPDIDFGELEDLK